jgi:hypothetical protein
MNRRQFIISASMTSLAAIVPATLVEAADPIIEGLVWQTCPFGEKYPPDFMSGQIGPNKPMPLSWWLARMERHRWKWPVLYWREFGNRDHGGQVAVGQI